MNGGRRMVGPLVRRGALEERRHVVRVAGRTLDEHGAAVPGAAVALWTEPGFDGTACMLRGQTVTRADGLFYFLDCPGGQYVASAAAAGDARGTANFRVDSAPADGAPVAAADITCRRAGGHATPT